ncbi:sulfate permease, SulP family [Gammaproteobacteria bacterium]
MSTRGNPCGNDSEERMAQVFSTVNSKKPSVFKFEAFIPKSFVCWREGYSRKLILNDLIAGVTVAIIALPLSLALAIGSGVSPEKGLYTAIIAGFLTSLLGGSRVQIGGPAGAFMGIVAGIVAKYGGGASGYQALAICALMAGIILIIMGLMRLGSLIKFIPYPVTTGFTSGIAVIILSSQVNDFLGLSVATHPGFIEKWQAIIFGLSDINPLATAFALGSIIIMVAFRKLAPQVPGAIVVVAIAAIATAVFGIDAVNHPGGLETIGTKFGTLPDMLQAPSLPIKLGNWAEVKKALSQARALIPEAITIAVLCAIESLLCAVVADGMIGARHKSNCELLAQGTGNIASILFGGIPATGVIARTAANVKNGGRTPLAGMIHSITLLLMMVLLARYAVYIPLSVLAAILVLVAWNMAEIDHFRSIFKAPRSDIVVLLSTFGLTVLTDITVAVGAGMVMASLLFMKRMSEVTYIDTLRVNLDDDDVSTEIIERGDPSPLSSREVPNGVEVYEINGPFFFGAADKLKDTLHGIEYPPQVFILRMRRVSAIDATGMHALQEFYEKCRHDGTRLLLAGVHSQPIFAMTNYGLVDKIGQQNMFGNIDGALEKARELIGA